MDFVGVKTGAEMTVPRRGTDDTFQAGSIVGANVQRTMYIWLPAFLYHNSECPLFAKLSQVQAVAKLSWAEVSFIISN